MEEDARLKSFLELFNRQEFFQAHEVLEDLWRETWGVDRDFYQGLIQMAAAFVHAQKGRWESAEKLFLRASERLKNYPKIYQGVHLEKALSEMRQRLEAKNGYSQISRS